MRGLLGKPHSKTVNKKMIYQNFGSAIAIVIAKGKVFLFLFTCPHQYFHFFPQQTLYFNFIPTQLK